MGRDAAVQPHSMGGVSGGEEGPTQRNKHTHTEKHTHTGTGNVHANVAPTI